MTAQVNHARQWMLWSLTDATVADTLAGNTYTLTIPPGALLDTITIDVTTAFNAGTTATMTVGDGTTTFASAVSIAATGRETVANIGKYYPNGGTLTISTATTGTAPTTGEAFVGCGYLVVGRANEVQA